MIGRSVENEIEIRADIKTHALLSRGSTDIYADICTVYVSNSCHFPQFADRLGISVQAYGLIQVLQNLVDLNLHVVQRLLQNIYIVKLDAKIYFSADCGHGWHFKSICTALLAKYFGNE